MILQGPERVPGRFANQVTRALRRQAEVPSQGRQIRIFREMGVKKGRDTRQSAITALTATSRQPSSQISQPASEQMGCHHHLGALRIIHRPQRPEVPQRFESTAQMHRRDQLGFSRMARVPRRPGGFSVEAREVVQVMGSAGGIAPALLGPLADPRPMLSPDCRHDAGTLGIAQGLAEGMQRELHLPAALDARAHGFDLGAQIVAVRHMAMVVHPGCDATATATSYPVTAAPDCRKGGRLANMRA